MPEAPDGRARAAGVLAGSYAPASSAGIRRGPVRLRQDCAHVHRRCSPREATALAVDPDGVAGAPLAFVAMPGVSYVEVEAA